VSALPPDAERESASESSPPHGPGFYQLSVCPKYARFKDLKIQISKVLEILECQNKYLSVKTKLLDFIKAVDHHVHERKQRVHVFGRRVAHARHYKQKELAQKHHQ